MTATRITLEYPITHNSQTITELSLRRPTVGDNLAVLKSLFDKASALDLKLRTVQGNQCERYFVNAGKADKEDYITVFSWLNKYEEQKCAVEEIDASVWGWLGLLYENGRGTKKNIDKAIHYHTKSANKGNIIMQYFLGRCLIEYKKNYKTGLIWMEKAASGGDIDAQFTLGVRYSDEDSSIFNPTEAFKYFEMGAKQGDIDCSYHLALLYYLGEGTKIDIGKALSLFYYAAERGEEDAAHYVSWLLLHEFEITDELLEEAYLWLEVSKHFGSRLDEDGELEKRLLNKLSPNVKAKIDGQVEKFCSEIERGKKGL